MRRIWPLFAFVWLLRLAGITGSVFGVALVVAMLGLGVLGIVALDAAEHAWRAVAQ